MDSLQSLWYLSGLQPLQSATASSTSIKAQHQLHRKAQMYYQQYQHLHLPLTTKTDIISLRTNVPPGVLGTVRGRYPVHLSTSHLFVAKTCHSLQRHLGQRTFARFIHFCYKQTLSSLFNRQVKRHKSESWKDILFTKPRQGPCARPDKLSPLIRPSDSPLYSCRYRENIGKVDLCLSKTIQALILSINIQTRVEKPRS